MKRIAIPPMLGDLIRSTILAMDGVSFDDLPACPDCGGPVKRHDRKDKRFAAMLVGGKEQNIHVLVSRFRCSTCGGFWYAREPFYEGVRFGIPIVDLAIVLSRVHPFHHTERILASLGILVDRGTIRMYAGRAQREVQATDLLGIPLPISLLNLSNLVSRRPKGAPVTGAEVLAALGLPPAGGAAPDRAGPAEKRDQRHEQDEEKRRDVGETENRGQGE